MASAIGSIKESSPASVQKRHVCLDAPKEEASLNFNALANDFIETQTSININDYFKPNVTTVRIIAQQGQFSRAISTLYKQSSGAESAQREPRETVSFLQVLSQCAKDKIAKLHGTTGNTITTQILNKFPERS